MTVESASYITDFNVDLPVQTDRKREGDNHIRLIKQVLKSTFPNMHGPVLLTSGQLNAIPNAIPGFLLRGKTTVAAGQLAVGTPFHYIPGAHNLRVLMYGAELRPGADGDYVESTVSSITLNHVLLPGTELDFIGGYTTGSPGPQANSVTLYGNESGTLFLSNYLYSRSTHIWNQPLTLERGVTLSTDGAYNGGFFRIVRAAVATGAPNLVVGGLKNLQPGQWADFEYSASGWMLTAFGSL